MRLGDEAAPCGPETGQRWFVLTGNESSFVDSELFGGPALPLIRHCIRRLLLQTLALCVLNQAASSVQVPRLACPSQRQWRFCPRDSAHPPVRAPSARETENKGMTDDGGPSQGSTVKKVCAVRWTIRTFRRGQYSDSYWKPAEEKRNGAPDSTINVKTGLDGGSFLPLGVAVGPSRPPRAAGLRGSLLPPPVLSSRPLCWLLAA